MIDAGRSSAKACAGPVAGVASAESAADGAGEASTSAGAVEATGRRMRADSSRGAEAHPACSVAADAAKITVQARRCSG